MEKEQKAKPKAKKVSANELATEVASEKKWILKGRLYKLKGKNAKTPRLFLQSSDRPGRGNKRLLYFDKETQRQRALRYVVNFESPFVDEQDNSGWDLRPERILFEKGHLFVDAHDVSLQKFLEVHPWNEKNNGGGPVEFYEHDPEAVAKVEVDSLLLEAEAIKLAMDADVATTEAVLRPRVGNKIHEMKTDQLTREILLFAKKEPKLFLEAIKDEQLLLQNVAYTAIDYGICKISDNGTVFRWVDNNTSLVSIPFGRNPYQFLAGWFSTDIGLEVMNKITQKLKKQ